MFETENKKITLSYRSQAVSRGDVPIKEISRPVDVETEDSLEDNLYKHKARGEDYVVAPASGKYFEIASSTTHELTDEMVVRPDKNVIAAMQNLSFSPFLLVDLEKNTRFQVREKEEEEESAEPHNIRNLINTDADSVLNYDQLKEQFPSVAEEYRDQIDREPGDRYEIVTQSEINKRHVKEALYPTIGGFEREVASVIQEEYPESEVLADVVGRMARETWEKHDDVHISEFLNLTDMAELVSDSDKLAEKCGFNLEQEISERDDEGIEAITSFPVEEGFSEIKKLRNKVMHSNRALVSERDDVVDVVFRIQLVMALLAEMSEEYELVEN